MADMVTDIYLYNVYLANVGASGIAEGAVARHLRRLFKQVLDFSEPSFGGGGYFDSVWVEWCTSPPPLAPWDLLIYFVPTRDDSVVRRFASLGSAPKSDGFTFFKAGQGMHASEVFASVSAKD